MPEDVAELDKKIKELGLVILTETMPTTEIQFLNSVSEQFETRKYLIMQSDTTNIHFDNLPLKKRYWINSFRTPVIEIDNSVFDTKNNILHEGRIYYEKQILGNDNKSHPISIELQQKADELFKWLRKKLITKKIAHSYLSPKAQNQALELNTELQTGSNNSINEYLKNPKVHVEKHT